MKFEITILGCGSALPTTGRNPSAQLINIHEHLFLMDCGEGTQQRLRMNKIRIQRISHILISHLHGDHYLGLIGLLSTFNLLGRKKEVTLIGPHGLEEMLALHSRLASSSYQFPIRHVTTSAQGQETVYESEHIEIRTFPLIHKIQTTGFLYREKNLKRKINKKATDEHGIGVKDMARLARGEDVVLEDGTVIPNSELTFDPHEARAYAYCSDTAYNPHMIETLKNIDLLYHEATFMEEERDRAAKTKHSTAAQAATIAKEANVKKLLIGHFSARYNNLEPLLEESLAIFKETELAIEGKVVAI